MTFADRVERVEPSATLAISNKASALEAEGVDVVDLSVGEPDFPTPEPVVEAGHEALDAGHTGYTPSNGIPELREAIAEKHRANGVDCGPENVLVTPGGKQALFETFQTLVDDGDEVVLLDPAWVSYEAQAKLADATLERVNLAPHGFQLEPALDELAAAMSDDTALVVVNSPSNPTGAVYTEAAFEGVRDLAVEHDAHVVSDEIYEQITYGVDQPAAAAIDGLGERTITVDGFSKSFSMTGWRLGYLLAPEEIVSQAGKVHSHSVSCATNFVQHAGVTALTDPAVDDAVEEMVAAFHERRDLLAERLTDHGVDLSVGDGAFYAMPRVDDDDVAWCEAAIEDAHVACVPGSAFGAPGHARFSYAASTERLEEAVDRLSTAGLI
ncbi:MAG: pyridoxal phosphate-dependent aminotransferase [Haloferacaceae archaeon]